jgi:hypothetical protein
MKSNKILTKDIEESEEDLSLLEIKDSEIDSTTPTPTTTTTNEIDSKQTNNNNHPIMLNEIYDFWKNFNIQNLKVKIFFFSSDILFSN